MLSKAQLEYIKKFSKEENSILLLAYSEDTRNYKLYLIEKNNITKITKNFPFHHYYILEIDGEYIIFTGIVDVYIIDKEEIEIISHNFNIIPGVLFDDHGTNQKQIYQMILENSDAD